MAQFYFMDRFILSCHGADVCLYKHHLDPTGVCAFIPCERVSVSVCVSVCVCVCVSVCAHSPFCSRFRVQDDEDEEPEYQEDEDDGEPKRKAPKRSNKSK